MSAGLKGTSAVVTGASSGIGRAIAVALATAGTAKVVVHYCHNSRGAEATAEILRGLGCDAITIAADLSEADDRVRLAEQTFDQLQTIDHWIHNAGADVLTGEAANWSWEQKLDRLWRVDVRGTILLARMIAPRMKAQSTPRPSSMIFIGWDQAPHGMEGDAGMMFGPTKAAVMAFSKSLAQTLAPEVRVNTIAPGWIQTSWGNEADEYWDNRAKDQALMHRWGTPEDVARAAVYLTDPDNSFVTGQTIEVNGGWNRRMD